MIKNDLWKAIESYRMAGGREEHWARRDALDSALDGMQAEVDELRQENARLRDANDLLDNALIAAFPMGAKGLVFELWNAARAALEGK